MIKYKDTADAWNERITEALDFRRTYGLENNWFMLEAMYANLKNSGAEFGPNIQMEMADAIVARLGVGNPAISVSPSVRDPRSLNSYSIVQAIDNWLISELNMAEIMQDVILHAYLWPRGILKIGYDSEWGFDEAFDLGTYDDPVGMTLTQFSKRGKRLEYGPARPGMPWVAPVLPHDFVVPWGTVYLFWSPWAAHRVIRHVDLLKADVKYTDTKDLQPTVSMKDVMDSYKGVMKRTKTLQRSSTYSSRDSTNNVEFVELWEIHNRVTGEIIVVSDTKIHRKTEDLLQVDGLPFKSLALVRHPRSFWGTPQAEYIRFHQAEQADIAIQAAKQRRANVLKYLIQHGAMTETEKTRALSATVAIAAELQDGINVRDAIQIMPQSNNVSVYQDSVFVSRNARSAVGMSPNQLGEYDTSSRRTATEASSVQISSDRRMGFRQAAVSRMWQDTIRFLNQVIFTFWKTPRVFQVAQNEWPRFTGEEIEAEYSYEVAFGLSTILEPTARRLEAMNLYLTLRTDPSVNQIELRRYLSRVYNDVEINRLFITEKEAQNAALSLPMSQMPQGT